jgi:hypothetical protein
MILKLDAHHLCFIFLDFYHFLNHFSKIKLLDLLPELAGIKLSKIKKVIHKEAH